MQGQPLLLNLLYVILMGCSMMVTWQVYLLRKTKLG